MGEGLRATLSFGGAFALALAAIPLARAIALRTDFLDRPRAYKIHGDAVPYLGGAGVLAAFAVVAIILGGDTPRLGAILGLAAVLAVVSSADDRHDLRPLYRFGVQFAASLGLWLAEVRWEPFGFVPLDLTITIFWVVGLANAYNLLDNIDGATAAVAGSSGVAVGAVALDAGAEQLAAVAFALAGACLAFLPFNFSQRMRIFLGDGGAVPIGFLIAALAILIPAGPADVAVLAAVPLAGVAIFDTALVTLSRTRRGISVLTGGRDHSTHRLLGVVGSPARVAGLLAMAQLALGGLAFWLYGLSADGIVLGAAAYVAVGLATLYLFEAPRLAPGPDTPRAGRQEA